MEVSLLFLAQCAVLGTALGAGDPPPLPSYNFGITGEPTKVDTAFGNLGELGPKYNVPQERNDTTLSSGGNPQQPKTNEPTIVATATLPSTTSSETGASNSSMVEEITTVRTTDHEEGNVSESSLFSTTQATLIEGIMETSPSPYSTQTFGTTAVSKEPSTIIAENTNSSNTINSTTNATTNPMAPANPNTPSWQHASTLPPRVTQTPEGTPSQTFHTGSPSSTDIPPKLPPGRNETKPGQNSMTPSKPNSSMSLYHNNGNNWLILAVFTVIYMTDIKGN